ncbi:hypothetical protein ACFW4T_24955 [Streptomyces mutabilis]|uniref:hypothetical protein n=1 Tax=Streptomyces mutabilis TaxID=67332 RepID=UPI0036978A51
MQAPTEAAPRCVPLPVGPGQAGAAGAATPFLFLLGEASGKLVVATDVPSFFLRVGGWEGAASAERTGALGLGVDGRPVTAHTTWCRWPGRMFRVAPGRPAAGAGLPGGVKVS